MSTPSTSSTSTPVPFLVTLKRHVEPFLAPYYLTVAGALGAITVAFLVVFLVLILLATNFNVLGWME